METKNAVARMAEIKDQQIAEMLEQERKKKSPFTRWVQMNIDEDARNADDWLISKSPAAYRIFKFLIENMDKYNAVICSYLVMQEKFGYSQATVKRAIKLLKEHKYIETVRTGGSNIYMVNKQLYWNSWGTNYAYAEFGARIIVSASEQDEGTQHEIQLQLERRQEVTLASKADNKSPRRVGGKVS